MPNQNFVVHNGLTVGALTIDAATSNVSLPVGKQILIGNVLLRDNGDGKLHVRDATDNSDGEIVATLAAISSTAGNIQIGTNHIESTNPNGPISLRPNGSGNIAMSANTIMIGKGGAFTLVGTGIQTDPIYGINYTPSNIIIQTAGASSSGNVRLDITTPCSSTTTGALQVMGGVGVVGNLNIGGNLTVTGGYAIPSSNAASSLGTSAARWNFIFGVNGNFLSVNANYADLAENYLSDAWYEPGTVLMFGGNEEVTVCDSDMSTAVAGVVSTNPGYLMNQGLEGSHVIELALTGRVPTKVTGAVKKGDLMVSAGNGRARAESNPLAGSIIGKALENSDGDTVIEVVIGKH